MRRFGKREFKDSRFMKQCMYDFLKKSHISVLLQCPDNVSTPNKPFHQNEFGSDSKSSVCAFTKVRMTFKNTRPPFFFFGRPLLWVKAAHTGDNHPPPLSPQWDEEANHILHMRAFLKQCYYSLLSELRREKDRGTRKGFVSHAPLFAICSFASEHLASTGYVWSDHFHTAKCHVSSSSVNWNAAVWFE